MERIQTETGLVKGSVVASVLAVAGVNIAHDTFVRGHNDKHACAALARGAALGSTEYRAILGKGAPNILQDKRTVGETREACVTLGVINDSSPANEEIARSLLLTASDDDRDEAARLGLGRDLVADAAAEIAADLRYGPLAYSQTSESCADENQKIAADVLAIARAGGVIPSDLLDKLFAPCPPDGL